MGDYYEPRGYLQADPTSLYSLADALAELERLFDQPSELSPNPLYDLCRTILVGVADLRADLARVMSNAAEAHQAWIVLPETLEELYRQRERAEAAEAERDAPLGPRLVGIGDKTVDDLIRHYKTMAYGQGCQCAPPGSGEEWCVGTCWQRERAERAEAERDAALTRARANETW